jgi:hypothetical protein
MWLQSGEEPTTFGSAGEMATPAEPPPLAPPRLVIPPPPWSVAQAHPDDPDRADDYEEDSA